MSILLFKMWRKRYALYLKNKIINILKLNRLTIFYNNYFFSINIYNIQENNNSSALITLTNFKSRGFCYCSMSIKL